MVIQRHQSETINGTGLSFLSVSFIYFLNIWSFKKGGICIKMVAFPKHLICLIFWFSSCFQVLCVQICMFYSSICLVSWPLCAETAKVRCGSDLLSDLMFVCGDRGIYLRESALSTSCGFTVSLMRQAAGWAHITQLSLVISQIED